MNAPLAVWKVWMRPAEYPHGVLARRFVLEDEQLRPTEDEVRGSHLDIVRGYLQARHPANGLHLASLSYIYPTRANVLGLDDDDLVELWFENVDGWGWIDVAWADISSESAGVAR